MTHPQNLKAGVLFAGIGGGTIGLQQAGYDVVLAVEINPIVARNHERLTGVKTIVADLAVADLSAICKQAKVSPDEIALVLASPPCERITNASNDADPDHPLNNLLKEVPAKAAKAFPNAYVVVENVKNLARERFRPVLEACLENLARAGRMVPPAEHVSEKFILQAADYGVAQRRERVFLPIPPIGKPFPQWPAPTHANPKLKRFEGTLLKPWVGIGAELDAMIKDPDPRFPPFREPEYACYCARDSKWTKAYRDQLVKRDRERHGSRSLASFTKITPADAPLNCLTAKMRVPSRCAGLHPSGRRYLTIGEIMVAAFGFPASTPKLRGSIVACWDWLADAIVPKVAEIVGRTIMEEYLDGDPELPKGKEAIKNEHPPRSGVPGTCQPGCHQDVPSAGT